MHVQILKADGTYELFQEAKLRASLKHAGADAADISRILSTVRSELYEGMRTETIYRRAFSLLKKTRRAPVAARYSMRRALFDLGPTGFPFEDFIARLFEAYGYTTHSRTMIYGECVPHEIDIIGYKGSECFIGEIKFHLHPGIKSDVQTALYSYARFLDLKGKKIPVGKKCPITSMYVITNTKFSAQAEYYAKCKGIALLSWFSPKGNTLQDMVEKTKLYPVTALSSLTKGHKTALIKAGTVVCQELLDNPVLLSNIGVPERLHERVFAECRSLVGI